MRREILDGTRYDRMVGAMPGHLDAFLGEEFDEDVAAIAAADAAAMAAERVWREHPAELELDPGSFGDEGREAVFERGLGDDEDFAFVDDWLQRNGRAPRDRFNE